ncbi:MAG: YdeI/OmpD-associated family protein [Cyclobacteriaceae bacterium]|nr:YdeI/OmpD-associated family protein [Cyclobacteriaceae bacterium]
MEVHNNIPAFHARTQKEWRAWLKKNHQSQKSVWLIIYRKESKTPSVYYPEAVDEALCFGWIDSKPNKRDAESYYLFFAKRSPKSNWSKINKEKVARLIKAGQMQPAGLEMIRIAKEKGTWTALDEVERITLPDDLKQRFARNKKAFKNWENFPKSAKSGILQWILNAKRPETRQKRIEETVALAAKNIRANSYPKPNP